MKFLRWEIIQRGGNGEFNGEVKKRLDRKYGNIEKKFFDRFLDRFRAPRQQPWPSVSETTGRPAQTREAWDSPFSNAFNSYQPFKFNLDLYDVIRESVPICDAVISKKGRLIGDFEVTAEKKADVALLDEFKRKVKVNYFERGFDTFRIQMTDSALAKGMGFGEVIPTANLNDVYRLKVARANDFRFVRQDDKLVLGQQTNYSFNIVPFESQDYIHYLAFDKRDGHPQGYSIFYGLPFVTQIMVRLMKALENQVWRIGDPSYLGIVEKGGESATYNAAKAAASGIQSQMEALWQDKRQGKVRDIFAALPGDASILVRAVGDKEDIFEMEIPVRTILEQMIAKFDLPPFMFGLSWATTERMSSQQNDMIIALIGSYRNDWDPIVEKIFDTFLILNGKAGTKWNWEWNQVNLMDETEQARTRFFNAQAMEKEINNLISLVSYGWLTTDDATQQLIELGIISRKMVQKIGAEELMLRMATRVKELRARRMAERLME